MASEVRSIIKEIENELAQAEYQAAQWRGLATALALDGDRSSPYYIRPSTLEEIKNWDIDAKQAPDGEVVVTLTKAGSES